MGYVAFVFPSFNHSCSTLFFCVSQEESHTPGCFSLMKTLDYSVVPGQQFRCKEVALSWSCVGGQLWVYRGSPTVCLLPGAHKSFRSPGGTEATPLGWRVGCPAVPGGPKSQEQKTLTRPPWSPAAAAAAGCLTQAAPRAYAPLHLAWLPADAPSVEFTVVCVHTSPQRKTPF